MIYCFNLYKCLTSNIMLVTKRFFTAIIVNGDEFQWFTWCELHQFLSQYFGQQCSEKSSREHRFYYGDWTDETQVTTFTFFYKKYAYSPLLAIQLNLLKSTNEYGRFQLSIPSCTRQLKYYFIRLDPFYYPVCH